MSDTNKVILNVLEEKLGIIVLYDDGGDFSLMDYIPDSMTFIQFIVALEESIGSELSDDFLDAELMNSYLGFSEKLDEYLSESRKDTILI